SPRSNHSPTYGVTLSATNRRTVSRIARSSSERRVSTPMKSSGSIAVVEDVVATGSSYGSMRSGVDRCIVEPRFNRRADELAMAAIEQSPATGVSFQLTDEQKELRALAREFAEKEIRPLEADCDVAMRHPAEVIEKAHETGLMNLHVPEEYGGPGLPTFDG